jgi:adenylate cyclase
MGTEIERKFLVADDRWRGLAPGVDYRQGYLSRGAGSTVRVRIAGPQGWLTIKGPTQGFSRSEFEYPVPVEDVVAMLGLCELPPVEKTRHKIPFAGWTWEVDEFHGANEGLIVAEIELPSEDTAFELPPWIGAEVTDDPRYANSRLSEYPYSVWRS